MKGLVIIFLTLFIMRSLNRVMLIGHLAADVDLRQTKSGISVANFPIAINRIFIDSDGVKAEAVDFHRVVAWAKLGEICAQFLSKGVPVFVEGRLVNRSFDDKEGNKHYRTEIVAEDVRFLNWKKGRAGEGIDLEPISDDEDVKDFDEEEKKK